MVCLVLLMKSATIVSFINLKTDVYEFDVKWSLQFEEHTEKVTTLTFIWYIVRVLR